MNRTCLSVFCLLALGWGGAHAAPPVKQSRQTPESLCRAPEVALFDCETRGVSTFASICRKDQTVIFRHGTWWDKADLEVASTGHDGRARRNFARLGGSPNGIGAGGYQHTMRFIWDGVDFIAVVDETGRRRYESRLAIEKDNVLLANTPCKTTRHPDFNPPNFVDDETVKQGRVY